MKVDAVHGSGISHYNVSDITCAEMETLCSLKHRADDVCASMENKEKKTEYFTKEECNLLRAVLHKFTEEGKTYPIYLSKTQPQIAHTLPKRGLKQFRPTLKDQCKLLMPMCAMADIQTKLSAGLVSTSLYC